MKKKLVSFLFALILFHAPVTLADEKAPFSDIQPGQENFVAIQYLYQKGFINGYPDGTFHPDQAVTRAEALKMILLAFDVKLIEAGTPQNTAIFKDLESGKITTAELEKTVQKKEFSDIEPQAWYKIFVDSALQHKLINGYEDGSFRPHNAINLAEALKISLSAAQASLNLTGIPDNIFQDVKKEDWFSAFALYAKEHELVDISMNNTISADQQMTRGKLAELIYRILKSKEGYGFGVASFYGDGANGSNTASGQKLNNSSNQAAHKTLPFNSKVRVSNPTNGKFVDVTIIDRGPYTAGRVLDLTKEAFSQLESPGRGVIKIHYHLINEETAQ